MSLLYIKNALRLEDVVGRYTRLTEGGSKKLKGLCPLHNEKTPSFYVNLDTQLFYCYGCKTGGDVVTFLNVKENIPFSALPEYAKDVYGIDIPERTQVDNPKKDIQLKTLKLFYERFGSNKSEAINYLKSRINNFSNNHNIDAFFVSKQSLKDFVDTLPESNRQAAKDLGIFWEKNDNVYPAFGDRVIFPLFRYTTLVGLNGRTISQNPIDLSKKYLLTNVGEVYKKTEYLYGIQKAKEIAKLVDVDYVYITEGVLDCIALQEKNIPAVCVLGSYISDDQFKIIRQSFSTLYIALDGDTAGSSGANKSVHDEIFVKGIEASGYVVKLPQGVDVADYLNSNTVESFKSLPLVSFEDTVINIYIKNAQKACATYDDQDNLKMIFLKSFLPKLLHYQTNRFANSLVIRIAERVGFDLQKLFLMIDKSVKTAKNDLVQEIASTDPKTISTLSPIEINLLNVAYSFPRIIQTIKTKAWYTHLTLEAKDILDILDLSTDTTDNIVVTIQNKPGLDKNRKDFYLKVLFLLNKYDSYDIISKEFEKLDELMTLKLEKSKALKLTKATYALNKKNKSDVKEIVKDFFGDEIKEERKNKPEKTYVVY